METFSKDVGVCGAVVIRELEFGLWVGLGEPADMRKEGRGNLL